MERSPHSIRFKAGNLIRNSYNPIMPMAITSFQADHTSEKAAGMHNTTHPVRFPRPRQFLRDIRQAG